jgi:hypothetical protein
VPGGRFPGHVAGRGQGAPRGREHPAAGRGQGDLPGRTAQQPDTERGFERRQRARRRRLGNAQVDRGIGEAAGVRDGDQAAQLTQLHIHNQSV